MLEVQRGDSRDHVQSGSDKRTRIHLEIAPAMRARVHDQGAVEARSGRDDRRSRLQSSRKAHERAVEAGERFRRAARREMQGVRDVHPASVPRERPQDSRAVLDLDGRYIRELCKRPADRGRIEPVSVPQDPGRLEQDR